MAPRTSEQFEEIRESSREKILHAAMKLFSEQGYNSVSVSQIAKEAGVSKGLMYNYFESKEVMLQSIIDLIIEDIKTYGEEIEGEKDLAKKVEKMISISFRMLREKKEFYMTIMPLVTQKSVSDKMEEQLSGLSKGMFNDMEKTFKALKIKDAKTEAYKLAAMLDGIAFHYLFMFKGKNYPLDETEKSIMDQYKKLIRKHQ